MDYACRRMFPDEGTVGCNRNYTDSCAKTHCVCTHRMCDMMIQEGFLWWRAEKCKNPSLGPMELGCQDIKSFFLSFVRWLEDRAAMAYISACWCSWSVVSGYYTLGSFITHTNAQLYRQRRRYEEDDPQGMHVWGQNVPEDFLYIQCCQHTLDCYALPCVRAPFGIRRRQRRGWCPRTSGNYC